MSSDAEEAGESRRKYEFKKVIEDLREYEGSGTQFVIIYIPEDEQISDVVEYVIMEHSEVSNIKPKQTRTNVQNALTSIKDRLRYCGNFPSGNGIVMFSGVVDADGGQATMVTKVFGSSPEPIQLFRYHCDLNFLTGPLGDTLMDKGLFGLTVPDRCEANVGWLKGGRVEPVKSVSSLVSGKQRKGGQSIQCFAHPRLETVDNFHQEVAGMASDLFVPKRHDMDGIPVGGPSPAKDKPLDGDYLHHELQDPVVGKFDAAHTDESGLYDLADTGQGTLTDQEVVKDKKQMEEFFEKLHRGNRPTYGFETTRKDLVMGSVDHPLISENLRKDIAVYDCGGQEEYEPVDHRHDTPIHECDDDSEAEPKDREDVIEWPMDLVDQCGIETKFISTDFEKGEQLYDAFGGITGIFRYSTGA